MNIDDQQEELQEWRVARLKAAVAKLGTSTKLGKALGYVDGAFVRQMLKGTRTVTENLVARLEALEGMEGWFNLPPVSGETLILTEEEIRLVLAHRAVRERPNPYIVSDDSKTALRKPKTTRRGRKAE